MAQQGPGDKGGGGEPCVRWCIGGAVTVAAILALAMVGLCCSRADLKWAALSVGLST